MILVRCAAVANQRGEHIPCDITDRHSVHGNREHGLIWLGAPFDYNPKPPSRWAELRAYWLPRAAAEIRHAAAALGYRLRPYDDKYDDRRWAWQRRGCRRNDPEVRAALTELAHSHLAVAAEQPTGAARRRWAPGDPCDSCGSRDTYYDDGVPACRACHRTDADE